MLIYNKKSWKLSENEVTDERGSRYLLVGKI